MDAWKWYAASAIYATRFRDRPDECPLVEERLYLVNATTHEEASDKAIEFAKAEEMSEYRLEFDGLPAKQEFIGIRKVTVVSAHVTDGSNDVSVIRSGFEASYSYFELRDASDLTKLVAGEPVTLTYKE
jgi:hypothetical protein